MTEEGIIKRIGLIFSVIKKKFGQRPKKNTASEDKEQSSKFAD